MLRQFGQVWTRVFGLLDDAFIELVKSAVDVRFPSRAPVDALPELAFARRIDIGFDEPTEELRERIRKAHTKHSFDGTRKDAEDALRLAGYQNFELRDASQDGSLQWFEVEIVLFRPFPFEDHYLDDQTWGAAGNWGDGGLWAPDIPRPHLRRLRSIVRSMPKHVKCRSILLVHEGETWDADAPPGTWDDNPLATWTDNVSTLSPY